MGFFDYYKPRWKKNCPSCFRPLTNWQGSEGPCGFFVWQQHTISPIEQPIDADVQIALTERKEIRLPETFTFSTHCESCETFVKAEGLCVEGIWRHTFMRAPDVPYPSGEEHPLFLLQIDIEELATKLGKEINSYEEDGLGVFKAIYMKLSCGASVALKQSEHLSNVALFGDKAHPGPTVYVDAFDAIKYGYEKIYWGTLTSLNLSKSAIYSEISDAGKWLYEARKLFTDYWNYWDEK